MVKQLYMAPTHHVFASHQPSLEAQGSSFASSIAGQHGGKAVRDGLVTAIKVPVNCTGTIKDPLSRIPEDISRADEVQMCVKVASAFCNRSFSGCK